MNNDPKWMTPKQREMQAAAQLPCIKSDARRLTPKQKLTELESLLKRYHEALERLST